MCTLRAVSMVLSLVLAAGQPAWSGGLMPPEGRVILQVTGAVTVTNGDNAAAFDLKMLEGLESRETTAETPWYDDVHTFQGPLLSQVAATVGAEGRDLRVRAINGYEATIPASDIAEMPIILATRVDGKVLSVRDKGPIFIIYPFDLGAHLYNETYFSRSVWQVVSIEAL
jgi:hypothetical protein